MHFRARAPLALRHPETGEYIVPGLTAEYDADDPLVRAFPDEFVRVGVEEATANPGERRSLGKKKTTPGRKKKNSATPAATGEEPQAPAEPQQPVEPESVADEGEAQE